MENFKITALGQSLLFWGTDGNDGVEVEKFRYRHHVSLLYVQVMMEIVELWITGTLLAWKYGRMYQKVSYSHQSSKIK